MGKPDPVAKVLLAILIPILIGVFVAAISAKAHENWPKQWTERRQAIERGEKSWWGCDCP
jgi:hypothetical protein